VNGVNGGNGVNGVLVPAVCLSTQSRCIMQSLYRLPSEPCQRWINCHKHYPQY
jgi:hypothetical protein